MKVTVFRGPSIGSDRARELVEQQGLVADVRPPAAQGDVWSAVRDGTDVVVLIDGVYERVPAVWHKEILAAIDAGASVIGAASMGALRAAECHRFGMIGHGEVYTQVRDGRILADADVAVAHADAEDDHRPLSVAMVDIRATLSALAESGGLAAKQATRLLAAASSLHFRQRSWPAIAHGAGEGRLARSLRAGHVRVKHADAVEALESIGTITADGATRGDPSAGAWRMQDSDAWRRASADDLDPILADLLRLSGRWTDLQRAGLLRRVAEELVPPIPAEVAVDELASAAAASGLSLQEWAARAGIPEDRLTAFAVRQARLARLWQRYGVDATAHIPDQLRLEGSWPDLLALARTRAEAPAADPGAPSDRADPWTRYVATTGTDADPDTEAARLGFADRDALLAALRREVAVGAL